ncbi:sugar phosphate nucleotidyltransferase [Streptomyces zhihengii]|uniref:sugar phosphate nucleotidyltransferase n=1 Tax=Streptomyces zhihengii TaxID=1818004 RepID=UPI0033B620A0
MALTDVRAALLAGGLGERMGRLTVDLCKPLVPYAASCRLVDFSMANAVRSGVREVVVLSRHRERDLLGHLAAHWDGTGTRLNFGPHDALMRVPTGPPDVLPARPRERGTADALINNAPYLLAPGARDLLVLHADHVYALDYGPMVAAHRESGADMTIGVQRVERRFVPLFGMVDVDEHRRVRALVEKPAVPTSDLVFTAFCLFRTDTLREVLGELAARDSDAWEHDISRDVIPTVIASGRKVIAYPVKDYWADVGTAERYLSEHLKLLNRPAPLPPHDLPVTLADAPPRLDTRTNTLVGAGVAVSATASVHTSVLFPGCSVGPGAVLERAVLLPGARVPAGALVRDAVVPACPGAPLNHPRTSSPTGRMS